jgi:transposase-like protein
VWTLRGVRSVVPAAGVNQRLCIYGAMNWRTGRTHYLVHPKKNAQQFHDFLRQLLEFHSERKLVLVVATTPAITARVPSWRCWKITPTTCW